MSAINAKASRKMKKYAVLTREPRCFLGSLDFSWEQRKFEEIAVRSSVICSDDTLPRVEYEDIVSGTGRLNKDIYAKQSIKSGIAFHQGDVLYGKLRPYLQNWLLPTFDGLAVGDFWVLQPQNADSSFLYRLIQSRQFDEVANQSTGTKMPRADWKLVSKTVFSIPSNISEQAAIGTYFTALDSLITLHQRKCANLCSPSQVVFSLLFATSTFSWEQRKFGEITSKYENPVPTPHDGYYRLGIRSHAKGTFHSYVAKGQELETAQMHRVAAGNFIVNITFGWEHAVAITDKNDAGKLVSHRFPQFSFAEGMVPEFFRYVIVDEKFRHHLWLASPGGAGRNRVLKLDEMLNYLMRFPSRDEQIKIAEFFRHLDKLITLHQRECISFTGRADRLILTANKKRTTSSWEQRKLGDVVQITMGQSPDGSTYSDEPSDYILVQGNADLQNGWVCPRIWTTQITKKADAGDLIMSVRAPAGAMGKTAYNAVIGRGVAAIKGNEFIYQLLVKMDADGFWKTLSCGSTFESLNSDNIKNAEVKIPTTAEQIKIGGYFQQLDNLITLHQRKPFLMKWRTSDANRNQTNRLVL